jgi:hypothetical protein
MIVLMCLSFWMAFTGAFTMRPSVTTPVVTYEQIPSFSYTIKFRKDKAILIDNNTGIVEISKIGETHRSLKIIKYRNHFGERLYKTS